MANQRFGRKSRLLTAADYKAVFDKAEIKVSCPQLLILAIKSGYENPRLGLVIAKKHVRQAVQRNRIKRLIRESFRKQQQLLIEVDIVILTRHGADTLNNRVFAALLEKLWQHLIRRQKRLTAR